MTYRRKLIEVAIPLAAINEQSAREKSIRHGHPSTMHLWWSRKPTATARAVVFAQIVDDPGENAPEYREEAIERGETDVARWVSDRIAGERARLFDLIKRMVDWDNLSNDSLLSEVRAEILGPEEYRYGNSRLGFCLPWLPVTYSGSRGGGLISGA